MEGNLNSNNELNAAPKEFEAKQTVQQVQKPEEDSKAAQLPRMIRIMVKLSGGAIKDEQQAVYPLLIIAAIIFFISLYFWGVI